MTKEKVSLKKQPLLTKQLHSGNLFKKIMFNRTLVTYDKEN